MADAFNELSKSYNVMDMKWKCDTSLIENIAAVYSLIWLNMAFNTLSKSS